MTMLEKWMIACLATGLLWTIAPVNIAADEAMNAYNRGVSLYRDGKYSEASKSFREANRLRPTWKLLFNIAQCEAAMKRYGLAVEAFEAYLVGGGDDVPEERRDYVSNEIRRLQLLVGTLRIDVDAALDVIIDGEYRATTPLAGSIRIAAGPHVAALRQDGKIVYEKHVNLAGGTETVISFSKSESPASPVDAAEDSSPKPAGNTKKKSTLTTIGFAALGGGAAILIGGIATGATALAKSNRLEDSCRDKTHCTSSDKELKNSSDRLALTTDILLPVGGVIAATGLVLVILGKRRGSKREEAGAVTAAPVTGAGTVGVILTGRF